MHLTNLSKRRIALLIGKCKIMKGVDGSSSSCVVCLFGKKDSVLCDKKFKKRRASGIYFIESTIYLLKFLEMSP
jgi:hypothetical protein